MQVIKSVVFSNDDKLICIGSKNGQIDIHHAQNGKLVKTFTDNKDKVLSLSFSKRDYILASGGKDKLIRIFDMRQFQILHTFSGHGQSVNSVEFGNQSDILCSGSEDYSIKIWSLTNQTCISTLFGHKQGVCSVNFNNDDKLILSGSHDKFFRIWNTETAQCDYKYKGSLDGIYDAKFSPDNSYLAFTQIKSIQLWCIRRQISQGILEGHSDLVRQLSFSQNGYQLCSAAEDNEIRVWNLYTHQCEAILGGQENTLYGFRTVQFSNSGQLILSGSFYGLINIWQTNLAQQEREIQSIDAEINFLKSNYSGNLIYSAGDDSNIRISDLQGNLKVVLEGHEHSVKSLDFSPDGNTLVSASDDKTCILWDLETHQKKLVLQGHRHSVSTVIYSNCGKYICSGSFDKTIKIWNAEDGTIIGNCIGHNDCVSCVCYDKQDKYILSGSYDDSVRLWDAKSFKQLQIFLGHTEEVNMVCFGVNDTLIFSCSDDKTIRAWNIEQSQCKAILKGHSLRVECIAYSQTQNILCSGSQDKTIRCWNLESMSCQAIIFDQESPVLGLTFNQQGTLLFSADEDGYVILRKTDNLHNFIKLMILISGLEQVLIINFQEEILEQQDNQNSQKFQLFLKEVSPQIIKTLLPLGLSIIHYALYMNDMILLENIIDFATEQELYIQPSLDIFKKSPLHLAQGNRSAISLLIKYYSDMNVQLDASLNQGSNIFVDFLPLLLKERIPGIPQFLDARIFNALGLQPKVSEFFQENRIKTYPDFNLSYQQYQNIIPNDKQITNKCAVKFKIFDMPNILDINNNFLQELVLLPPNSKIFESEFVSSILQYKWNNYSQYYYKFDLTILTLNLFFFTFNALYIIPEKILYPKSDFINSLDYIICIINFIILVYYMQQSVSKSSNQIFQIVLKGLSSFLNVYDLLTQIMVFICYIMNYISEYNQENKNLRIITAFSLIFVWLRFLSSLRGFQRMGYFIRIFTQIMYDIKHLAGIIMLFLFQFTFIAYLLQNQDLKILNIKNCLQLVYRILMYDFDNKYSYPKDYDKESKIQTGLFFYMSTFILTMVTINIFVAIIQDTFDRVQTQEKIASNYERAQLIFQYENKMSKSDKQKLSEQGVFGKYMIIASCLNDDQYNQIDGTMRNKLSKIEKQLNKQKDLFEFIEDIHQKMNKIEQLQQQTLILESMENKHQIIFSFMERNLEKNQEIYQDIKKQIENVDLLEKNQKKLKNKINKIKQDIQQQ